MNRSVKIAIVMAVVATIWVLSGSLSQEDPSDASQLAANEASETNEPEALFPVRVKQIEAQTMSDQIALQGEVLANREIEIKAETHGTVAKLNAEKGDRLKPGATILNIAINDRMARLEQAKAELRVRKADLEAGTQLKAKRLISQNQHEQNEANVVAAQAAVKQIQVEIEHTRVNAAFAGVLDELMVEKGDYLSAGDPIARLVDDSAVTIRAQVPQQHIAKVKLGQQARAELLDGTEITGTITYIASSAHPDTRTFTIEAKADNQDTVSRFGQSARVNINMGERQAHKLSPSYLDLDNKGALRVKGIDANNQVITHSVAIIRNENDGVWLDGIPEHFELITVGQGFVSAGQTVKPIREEQEASTSEASL